ncbi:MAG: peptide ABC transporter substrate-binding protein [Oscillatoriales cyanobacterium SM2_1_8]|nr:peptide ABC transporter substrate-binding protein [Oscillatoriales cyanobacterium SM2_1_8]
MLSLAIAGCGTGLQPGASALPGIVLGTTATVRTLDPADNTGFFASNILYNTTERLYGYKPGTTELRPQLATDFPQISADGLTYTIPLRQGVKFHDGTPFDAETMAFSLRRFLTAGGAPSYLLTGAIADVRAVDAYTLEIQLKKPLAFFPKLLAFTGAAAISPRAYQNEQFRPDTVVGTGPYRVVAYQPGQFLRLQAFAEYWGEAPLTPDLTIQFVASSANLLNALKTGAVDIAFQTLSPPQVRNLRQTQGDWYTVEGPGATILYASLNLQQPPLTDRRVRQSLAAAIDRRLTAERVFLGQREPLFSLVPPLFPEAVPAFARYGDGNSPLAKQLLAEAGYSPDRPARIPLWYPPTYAGNGDLLAATLQAIVARNTDGALQLQLERVNQTTANAFIESGVYPAFLFDWVPDFAEADNYLSPFLGCTRAANQVCLEGATHFQGTFYQNPEINALLAQQRQEGDPARRTQQLRQIQAIAAADVPFVPLWQTREYAFARKSVAGLRLEPTQQLAYSTLHKLPPSASPLPGS